MILKTYEGVTSGTFMGRDDGYPVTRMVVYADFADAAPGYGTCKDEKYFWMDVIDPTYMERCISNIKKLHEEEQRRKEREKDEAELNRLKEKLYGN